MTEASERGRDSARPSEIPARGWLEILKRTWREMSEDHVAMIAAGIAFYALLALFPAIAATISIWGLMFDPHQIEAQIGRVVGLLPEEAASIVRAQAQDIAAGPTRGLNIAAIGGVLLALYSAAKGVRSLMEGLNIVYDETETRGFLRLNLVALGLTLAIIAVMIAALGLIIVLPALLGSVGLGALAERLISLLRWPLLATAAMVGLAVLYRFAPNRDEPQWRWVSWGAASATIVWVVGSIAFSIYVSNLGSYNETYGSLGAVIILLMWLWLSAMIVLMGAELNAEMEHQTAHDTTAGSPRPMGRRGAHVADTLGN